MTAVTSNKTSSKKNFFGTRYLNNISGNKRHLIINIVLEILGLPVLSVIAIIGFYFENATYHDTGYYELQDKVMSACLPFAVLAIATISISIVMGIVIALFHFSYLYKKTIVDMHYSLPLSSTQRFFADYLSGLTIYIAPAVGAIILSLIISGIGSIFVDMSEFWEVVPAILKLCLVVIIAMIQLYSMSIFAITFCGSTFESVFGIFAFICMIPATIACLWLAITETSGFGIDGDAILMKNIFTSTSPVGAFSFFMNYAAEAMYYSDDFSYYTSLYTKWILFTLLFNVIYTGAAYLLYKYRKAEDVSKPYVYKSFFYAVMTMAVFCILSLFITYDGFVIAGIVICAVGWFIMEVITRRGFKKFWTAPIGFAAAVVSVFVICQVCKVTDGFGASKHIPSAISIENVKISSSALEAYEGINFRDKDVIKSAVELNKEIIDRHFNPEDYTYEPVSDYDNTLGSYTDDINISFEYSTITGSLVMRSYYINSGMSGELIKAILLSDEYAEYTAGRIGITNVYDSGNNVIRRYTVDIYDKLKINSDTRTLTQKQTEELRKAYEQDMKNMTEEDLKNPDIYCFINDIWVLDTFENTIAVLDADIEPLSQYNIGTTFIPIITEPVFETDVQYYIEQQGTDYYHSYNNKGYDFTKSETITNIYPKYIYNDSESFKKSLSANNDDAIELLNRFTPIIIGEMPVAVIKVNETLFFLPDRNDNAELLEKVTNGSKKTGTSQKKNSTL